MSGSYFYFPQFLPSVKPTQETSLFENLTNYTGSALQFLDSKVSVIFFSASVGAFIGAIAVNNCGYRHKVKTKNSLLVFAAASLVMSLLTSHELTLFSRGTLPPSSLYRMFRVKF